MDDLKHYRPLEADCYTKIVMPKEITPGLLEANDRVLNELELEVVKWYCVDALCLSVKEKQIDRDKAADLLVGWFPGDKVALTALYKQLHAMREIS